jgi:glycosyltransferase involved in cell wall biosynthesis
VGSPVVAVAVGGISEIIIDGFNGMLAEPNSPESVAQRVIDLMEDEDKQKLVSSNAIKDSIARFSPETIAKKTLDFYREVLVW